jgi:hypothetical protein
VIGELEQGTEEGGMEVLLVVADQLVDAALDDEAAELDQATGTGTAGLHGGAIIEAGTGALSPVQQFQAAALRSGGLAQLTVQRRSRCVAAAPGERTPALADARRP